jgi:MtN3 and saliva related transmembrane protein
MHLAWRVDGVTWIGWVSSLVLLLTLGNQVRKQWRTGDSRGVSTWLFVGQLTASFGFTVYSWLLHNWVFLVTNLLLMINAMIGQWVTTHNRRRQPATPCSRR